MKINFHNIYNNLIKLTRNKNLYLKMDKQDTFSERIIIFFFHFSFFLKFYKSDISLKDSQELFDYVIKHIELSIREIGYGDVSVNKRMKEYVNIFYSIVEIIELWNNKENKDNAAIIGDYLNIDKNLDFFVEYFNNYQIFLSKNTLNSFTKDIINLKF